MKTFALIFAVMFLMSPAVRNTTANTLHTAATIISAE
jgi:hypothetical protein